MELGAATASISASQRGSSTRVPDLRGAPALLSRYPRAGTSSSKVHGTFCDVLVCGVDQEVKKIYLSVGEDRVNIVVGHGNVCQGDS